uniref:Uncharacterized protein n=1 Tax=Cajanus cajan TaxID=3821 RepID=A0A151UA95_CAJCA|nr:hypothetical protein KK1_020418 [Cajanus cajan]
MLGSQTPKSTKVEVKYLIENKLFRVEYELRIEYFDKNVLMALASVVGQSIKVDMMITNISKGKFFKVSVGITLDQPVVGRVWFYDHEFNTEYEGLHFDL